ncbi:LysE family translocator [Zooshikella ganghwensis]|uniref:LysE family translocator n=1 Tax=Zooshikella ganghwensis TaxID=202772 RepID=UPI000415219F|nr:LysE family translocator [Zooshikella ganghwensis]
MCLQIKRGFPLSVESVVSFAIIVALSAMLPGPNGLLIVNNSVSYGRKTAFVTLAGTLSAFYVHGLFSVIGVSALIMSSATAFTVFKYIGVVYLLYLGVSSLVQAMSKPTATYTPVSATRASCLSWRKAWSAGFITNLFNPKVSMFYLALFPQFVTETSSLLLTTLFLVTLQVIIVGCWFSSVAIVAESVAKKASGNLSRIVKGAAGSVMVWFGISLAQVQTRT